MLEFEDEKQVKQIFSLPEKSSKSWGKNCFFIQFTKIRFPKTQEN